MNNANRNLAIHIGIACFIIGGSLVATEVAHIQQGQTLAEHTTDLIPLLVGIVVILGGALIAVVTGQFMGFRRSLDEHQVHEEALLQRMMNERRDDMHELSGKINVVDDKVERVDKRVIKVETKLGIKNGNR